MARADVDLRRIGWLAGTLASLLVVAIVAVFLLLRHWKLPPGGDREGSSELVAFPEPRLQPAPQDDLARYRAEQRHAMEAVGWEDRPGGIVRIPVADAITLVAQGRGVR